VQLSSYFDQSNEALASMQAGESVDLFMSYTCLENGSLEWSCLCTPIQQQWTVAVRPFIPIITAQQSDSLWCLVATGQTNCGVIKSRKNTYFLSGCLKSSTALYRSAGEWQLWLYILPPAHTRTRVQICCHITAMQDKMDCSYQHFIGSHHACALRSCFWETRCHQTG
jgi:hypothetical protein